MKGSYYRYFIVYKQYCLYISSKIFLMDRVMDLTVGGVLHAYRRANDACI